MVLRSGPSTDQKKVAVLDAGRKAVILEHRDGWVKVRLGTGTVGWVHQDLIQQPKKVVKVAKTDKAARPVKPAKPTDSQKADVARSRFFVRGSGAARPSAPATTRAAVRAAGVSTETSGESKPLARVANAPQPTVPDTETESVNDAAALEPQENVVTRQDDLVRTALSFRGARYRRGATGGNGAFDCSGFMLYLFDDAGARLPRTAADQFCSGKPVSKGQLQAGDLVFFKNTYKRGVSHVGLYIGDGKFVHASGTGRGVRVDSLSKAYYINHWAGARRIRLK